VADFPAKGLRFDTETSIDELFFFIIPTHGETFLSSPPNAMKSACLVFSALLATAFSLPVFASEPVATPSKGPQAKGSDPTIQGEEKAVLTRPSMVPPPITREHPTKWIVSLEVIEKVKRMADCVDYLFWTSGVGKEDDVRNQFSHSNLITVLNAEGEVVYQQAGLNKDPKDTSAVLEKLLTTKTSPAP